MGFSWVIESDGRVRNERDVAESGGSFGCNDWAEPTFVDDLLFGPDPGVLTMGLGSGCGQLLGSAGLCVEPPESRFA